MTFSMIETSHGVAHHIIWCPRCDRHNQSSIKCLLYSYSECHSLSFISSKRFEWTKLWGTARLNHICTTQHEERFILLHIFNSQMNWTIATSYSIKMTKHFVWSIKGAEFSWKSILVCWRLTKVMPVHLLCSWSDILEVLFFTSCLHIKWNLVKPSSNFQFLWGSKCSHNDTTNGLINEEFSPFPLWNNKGL